MPVVVYRPHESKLTVIQFYSMYTYYSYGKNCNTELLHGNYSTARSFTQITAYGSLFAAFKPIHIKERCLALPRSGWDIAPVF